jgi:hypothetical protein
VRIERKIGAATKKGGGVRLVIPFLSLILPFLLHVTFYRLYDRSHDYFLYNQLSRGPNRFWIQNGNLGFAGNGTHMENPSRLMNAGSSYSLKVYAVLSFVPVLTRLMTRMSWLPRLRQGP